MEGITFRRPKISGAVVARKMLCMEDKSKIDMIQCTFDNEGGNDTVIAISGRGSKGRWESVTVRGGINGIVMDGPATLHLANVSLHAALYAFVSVVKHAHLFHRTCCCSEVLHLDKQG